jgi:hypothetical protein
MDEPSKLICPATHCDICRRPGRMRCAYLVHLDHPHPGQEENERRREDMKAGETPRLWRCRIALRLGESPDGGPSSRSEA